MNCDHGSVTSNCAYLAIDKKLLNKLSIGETIEPVTSRLLALILAIIIGSPACWCCAQSAPQPEKTKHSCCEQSAPAAPAQKDPCPCGTSMIKREMAKAGIDVPPPNLLVTALAPNCEPCVMLAPSVALASVHFYDTGPPHQRLPIYLRQHALLL